MQEIFCDHRVFTRIPSDLKKVPEKFSIVHSCDEITVYQEKRGMKRFYHIKNPNILKKEVESGMQNVTV